MAMLVLCVSGVIIHRRIFADFFTLRRSRQPQRLLLDLHNTAGVLGFLFYVVMALSGVTIFASVYFPSGVTAGFEDGRAGYVRDAYDMYTRPPAGRPGSPLASLDAMLATAREGWGGLPPRLVRVMNHGDAHAVVEVWPAVEAEVAMRSDPVYFDASTGAVLHRAAIRPVTWIQQYLTGLHFVQYRHWVLRWIYFLLGLLGCLLIATGLLFWVETRRKAHAAAGLPGVRLVEGLAVGGTAGLIVATLAFLVANRLLPAGATFFGNQRHELEIWIFFAVWVGSLVHGWWRPGRAWIEQCRIVAGLALAAIALNAVTTGDHLVRTVTQGRWAVAGTDLVLLAAAGIAVVTARRLQRRRALRQHDRLAFQEGVPS